MDDYDEIINTINRHFEHTPWNSPGEGKETIRKQWHELRTGKNNDRELATITKLLIIYCQLDIIQKANAPGRNMNWNEVWENMKLCTILVRSSINMLKGRWLAPRLGAICNSHVHDIKNRLETKQHVVYYICSPWNKHAYVGQTKDSRGWQYRIQEEIRTAKKVFYMRKKSKRKLGDMRTVDRKMGLLGFYNWIAIPVSLMGNHTTLQRREKIEEDIRRRLQPTMNMKNNPLAYIWIDKTHRGRERGRKPRWKRLSK